MPTRALPPRRPLPRRESAARRGYDRNWRRERETYLAAHPLCVLCDQAGRVVPATVVDHIHGHAGQADPRFWDRRNWQALCKKCHDAKTARENR